MEEGLAKVDLSILFLEGKVEPFSTEDEVKQAYLEEFGQEMPFAWNLVETILCEFFEANYQQLLDHE